MNVHEFTSSRRADWEALDKFVQQCGRLSLPRVPLAEFRAGTLLYRRTVADLAYARMRFPGSPAVQQLERLLGRAHSVVYQARRRSSTGWWRFWISSWPRLVYVAAPQILFAAAVFWIASAVGFFVTADQPQFEAFFVAPEMRNAIDSGHLWTEHVTKMAPMASSRIATNNISVSLLAWAMGISFGLGTLWMLIMNGLMLGVLFSACLRRGLFGALAEFVVGHGSLELPAIWICAGAGLVMAQAMLFPGRFGRLVELKQAARRSVQIAVGTVPVLLIAALVEGFISPGELPSIAKAMIGLFLAMALLGYILYFGRRSAATMDADHLNRGSQ